MHAYIWELHKIITIAYDLDEGAGATENCGRVFS
jgi:hypothetical protein